MLYFCILNNFLNKLLDSLLILFSSNHIKFEKSEHHIIGTGMNICQNVLVYFSNFSFNVNQLYIRDVISDYY